jgi:hypothetical protein
LSTDEILPAGARVLPYRSNIPKIAEFCFDRAEDEPDRNYYERARDLRARGRWHAIVAYGVLPLTFAKQNGRTIGAGDELMMDTTKLEANGTVIARSRGDEIALACDLSTRELEVARGRAHRLGENEARQPPCRICSRMKTSKRPLARSLRSPRRT